MRRQGEVRSRMEVAVSTRPWAMQGFEPARRLDESSLVLHDFANSLNQLAAGTVKLYCKRLLWLQSRIPCPLTRATLTDFNRVFADLTKYRHPSTVNGVRSAAKAWLRFLGRGDEAREIKIVSVRWLPRNPPSPELMDRCFDACRTARESALLHGLYSFAFRCFEASQTKASEVDMGEGKIRVWGKGGVPDYAVAWPRRDEALRALHRHLNGRILGSIFNLEHSGIRWIVTRVGNRVGVRLRPHLLRHAGAASLFRQNADIYSVKTWLRHRRIETTMGYTHLTHYDLIARAREKEWR